MSAVQPVAVYAMRIPPGDIMVPAVPEFAAMFRVTMAAIDPSEEIETEDVDHKGPPRATLKVIRIADDMLDEDDDDDDYSDVEDDEDDEEDSDEEEANGGPSDKKALMKALAKANEDSEDDEMDEDDDEDDNDIDAIEQLKKLIKGKGKALDGEDDDDEDDESDEGIELDECVICTLDPEKHYQQPIDFVVSEGEKIFFKVSGTHTVHLTGNYVMPVDDGRTSLYDEDDEDEEDEYDLSPDEDELDLEALEDEDEESDELDDLEDPRITEVQSDEEVAPKIAKGKNKRPADDSDDEKVVGLDEIMAKSIKEDAATNGEPKKMSKAEKKAAKKLKKNDGEAAPVAAPAETKKEATTNGSEKKVQFSKNLVQGPTPSATPPIKKDDKKAKPSEQTSSTLGVRDISGVTVDDRKLGSGPAAKKGSKLELRYIGKLDNGKVFDSNKSGKPFSLKLGAGDVIKGWDLGLQGISAGGERRMTIPAHLAYSNKAIPGIPKNSKLIFDVKCLSVK